ncbi:hypothetical protein DRO54_07785 [Candidatus Bathyarchaeota archaeon]|nr:MAG: hypothetical protein DRO54_07785 [Candidatus Bathyarchaeota archaeon]
MKIPYAFVCNHCGVVVDNLKWLLEQGFDKDPRINEGMPVELIRKTELPTEDVDALKAMLPWMRKHLICRCGSRDWGLVRWDEVMNLKNTKLRFTTIRVDEQVKKALEAKKVVGRNDSINKVLRRLLGLDR